MRINKTFSLNAKTVKRIEKLAKKAKVPQSHVIDTLLVALNEDLLARSLKNQLDRAL